MFHSRTAAVSTTTATIVNSEPAILSVEMVRRDLRSSRTTRSMRSIGTSTITRSSLWSRTKSDLSSTRVSRVT